MPVRMTKEGRASSREEYRYEKKEKAKKEKFLSGGQAKIAAKAPPPNKIDEKDFAVLRAEKAKGRGMGLQDESVKPGKVMKANEGEFIKRRKALRGVNPFSKTKSGLDLPVISSVKPTVNKSKRAQNLSKMKIQFNKQKSRMGKNPNTMKKYSSMAEMRAAKGFKPGESASEFNKRRMALNVAKKAASATTVGKIALGVGAAGVAAQQYLKSKMNKKKDVKKKMGGGMMMQRPMGYSKGGGFDSGTPGKVRDTVNKRVRVGSKIVGNRLTKRDMEKLEKVGVRKLAKIVMSKKYMGGGMMQKPMGYKHGTSVTTKCKLGRNKPTKIT